jgi:2-keto-4-pentenoate hydratase/2-oxohepta-3-ene-1,7-dioic acid hydratase in catechol pathway
VKIVRFLTAQNPLPANARIGVALGAAVFDYSAAHQAYEREVTGVQWPMITDTVQLIRLGRFTAEMLSKTLDWVADSDRLDEFMRAQYRLLPPLRRPDKIIALARNYAAHAKETGSKVPTEPVVFCKTSHAIIGPDAPIEIPEGIGRVDHEVELAVIIGDTAREIRREDAYRYVAGYTILNDVTARDLQKKAIASAHPWYVSKNVDTFCPVGPCIITPDAVENPMNLAIECQVNGETRQKDRTSSMIFDIPALIENITKFVTLEPGDVLSTGTPEGIGPIVPGDTVTCIIEGIGELTNPVVERANGEKYLAGD